MKNILTAITVTSIALGVSGANAALTEFFVTDASGTPTGAPMGMLNVGDTAGFTAGSQVEEPFVLSFDFSLNVDADISVDLFSGGGNCIPMGTVNCIANYMNFVDSAAGTTAATTTTMGVYPLHGSYAGGILGADLIKDSGDEPLNSGAWAWIGLGAGNIEIAVNGLMVNGGDSIRLTAGNHTLTASGNCASCTVLGTLIATPSEIPIPAAAWLFGTALVGLAGLGRNRKMA